MSFHPEDKTFSHLPEAHALDLREKYVPVVPPNLNVLKPSSEKQELPPYDPSVEEKTFSRDSNAHSV